MAVLVLVPCLVLMRAGVVEVDIKVWAPEPIELCTVFRYRENKSLWFNCKTPDGRHIRFSLAGVNKA